VRREALLRRAGISIHEVQNPGSDAGVFV